jgi:hypothetical protein
MGELIRLDTHQPHHPSGGLFDMSNNLFNWNNGIRLIIDFNTDFNMFAKDFSIGAIHRQTI